MPLKVPLHVVLPAADFGYKNNTPSSVLQPLVCIHERFLKTAQQLRGHNTSESACTDICSFTLRLPHISQSSYQFSFHGLLMQIYFYKF